MPIGFPFHEFKGSRAHRVLHHSPLLLHLFLRDDGGDGGDVSQDIENRGVFLLHVENRLVPIRHFDPVDLLENIPSRISRLGIQDPLDGVLHVVGHHLPAVVEELPLAQMESDGLVVGAHFPSLRQNRNQLHLLPVPDQGFKDMVQNRGGDECRGDMRVHGGYVGIQADGDRSPLLRNGLGRSFAASPAQEEWNQKDRQTKRFFAHLYPLH